MVRCGELLLIDVAFVQVRPSPWRQAVDLGNMMLVLALRTDPQRVYQRAQAYFTEAELAEAFATRGVASPTQLRVFIKRDPRDLLGEFRALAPPRPPIILQRWNSRRLALAAAMLAITVVAGYGTVRAFIPGPVALGTDPPRRGTGAAVILSAQAVPSAALLPCIAPVRLASGRRRHRQRACPVLAGLQSCRTSSPHRHPDRSLRHRRRPPGPLRQPGTQQFERQLSRAPRYSGLRYYTFPGGCVTYQFSFTPGASPTLAGAVGSALSFEPRSVLVDYLRRTEGLALCGRGAACAG